LARKLKSQTNAWPVAKPRLTLLSLMQLAQWKQGVYGMAWGVALDSKLAQQVAPASFVIFFLVGKANSLHTLHTLAWLVVRLHCTVPVFHVAGQGLGLFFLGLASRPFLFSFSFFLVRVSKESTVDY
jgi:hypothetical protein